MLLIGLEALLTCLVLIIAFAAPERASQWLAPVEAAGRRIAASPVLAILTVIAGAVVLRGALLPFLGSPVPRVQDEFSLLLQGEMFSQWRAVAPQHPLWPFFETVHVNVTPVHASIYFPGRSAPLVLGIWAAGDRWFGVWLTMIALAGAVTWMLAAWVRWPYALLGGAIVVLRFGLFSYWINSYWGGALSALGGVLVMGAVSRLLKIPRWRDGLMLALGLGILITSRPFEGALFCLPFAIALAIRLFGKLSGQDWSGAVRLSILPALGVLLGVAALGAYNRATTGDAFTSTYEANRERYAFAPAFLTSDRLEPSGLREQSLRDFYTQEAVPHERRESVKGIGLAVATKLRNLWGFYVGPALSIAFVIGAIMLARTRSLPVIGGAFVLVGFMLTTWDFPHYAAPVFGVAILAIVIGLQRLAEWSWQGRPTGRVLSRGLPIAMAAPLILPAAAAASGKFFVPRNHWNAVCCAFGEATDRSVVAARLMAAPGRDLIIVRHMPGQALRTEWVYNAPDPDRADIVWARDLGPERLPMLLARYPDRRHWVVEVGRNGARYGPIDAAR
jgi:hypothetical protein